MSLSPQQLEIRRTRVGSSEIGALVDFYAVEGSPRCDPYKTAQKVFNEKDLAPEPDAEEKAHQVWGLYQEPGILGFHAYSHDLRLVKPKELVLAKTEKPEEWQTLVHPTLPICATPDGIGERTGGRLRDIQAKNAQRFQSHRWGEPGTDDVPLLYVAQVTFELGILLQHEKFIGRVDDVGDLAVCMEGAPPLAYHIKFDPEMFAGLAHLAAKFKRDYLDTRKPPKIDGSDDAADYVRRRWQTHTGDMREWSADAQVLADIARKHAETEKISKDLKEAARNQLKDLIGESSGIEGVGTWKRCKDSTKTLTNWKAVAEALAADDPARLLELAAQHTAVQITKKGSRRLLLTKSNGVSEIEEEAA